MKRLFSILFLTTLSFSVFSKSSASPLNIVANASNIIKDDRDVKNFNGVVAGGPIHVVIKFGNTEGLKFEGDADAIATLVAEVKGNILIIRPKTSWKSWAKKYENKKITAYVTAKNITSLTMSGDGSINVTGTVEAAELTTTLSGSGSIKASVNADKLTGVLSGSGALNLSGKADEASVTLSGSGNFSGKTLTVNSLSTRISGSGQVNIIANESIKAVISGSGNVNYKGNAAAEQTVIGSGKVNNVTSF